MFHIRRRSGKGAITGNKALITVSLKNEATPSPTPTPTATPTPAATPTPSP
jgi:hypothetical protein